LLSFFLCFLRLGCNVLGLGFIFAVQYLIEVPRFGPPPLLPSNFFILGVLIVAAILLLFYNGEYKRLKHEKLEHLSENSFILGSSTENGESLLDAVDSATTHHPFSSTASSNPNINNKKPKYHPPNPSSSSPVSKGGVDGGVPDDSAIVRVTDGTSSQDQSMVNSSLVNNSMTMWVGYQCFFSIAS
jgi:hypothetical protein